jgi:hypothetical protein
MEEANHSRAAVCNQVPMLEIKAPLRRKRRSLK